MFIFGLFRALISFLFYFLIYKNYNKLIMFYLNFLLDIPRKNQLFFQDPATPIMEGIISLHNEIFFYLVVIFVIVSWFLYSMFVNFGKNFGYRHYWESMIKNYSVPAGKWNHDTIVEIVWTVIPSIILVFIALPSFSLLYAMDEILYPEVTLKVIGHQWYWTYEYTFTTSTNEHLIWTYDSYMIPDESLVKGDIRLLEVDNMVMLPIKKHIRVLVTSDDVLHAWAVPSLGLKVDAVPGRLNQICAYIKRVGYFFGQCSEICGVNHGFMPICVKSMEPDEFDYWLVSNTVIPYFYEEENNIIEIK